MLHHNHTFYTDKRELATLARVAGTDESRPGTLGVWFDPAADGRGRAWATDGHRAVVIDRDGRSRPHAATPIVAPELLGVCKLARTSDVIALRVGKPNGKRPKAVGWSIVPGRFEADCLLDALKSKEITGRDAVARGKVPTVETIDPPAIDQAMPRYDSSQPATAGRLAVDPALVATFFGDVARLESARAIRFWLAGERDPMLCMFDDANREAVWRYVVMPMRV